MLIVDGWNETKIYIHISCMKALHNVKHFIYKWSVPMNIIFPLSLSLSLCAIFSRRSSYGIPLIFNAISKLLLNFLC